MQGASENLRYQLWDALKVIYEKYAGGDGEIPTSLVETIVRDVLGETSIQEIQYVIKNMFRLDADGSGTVDFLEFGNFLFKRHCGEMSLQKKHRAGEISHGAQRKITLQEFFALINKAYEFLKVKMDLELAEKVFKEADKDEDGLITYVEYFQFIEKCVCQTKAQFIEYQKSPEKPKEEAPAPLDDSGREWNSRLRLYIWLQLRKLYNAYVLGRKLTPNDENLRGLIKSILGDLSEMEITFLLNGLFKLDKTIEFVPFAIIFIYLVAELYLSRYQRNHPSAKKTLNVEEFLVLFRNTFKFVNIDKVKRTILVLIFGLIDKNHDGLISLKEYLDWVKRFLAVDLNRGEEFYLKEDDESIEGGDIFESETPLVILPDPQEKKTTSYRLKKFTFSNYDLSDLVRKRVWELLIPFDKNKDLTFDESEIHDALTHLLKESETQLKYMTRNVFRYDVDGDKNVTYDELTNFCVQQHFGEMAIQRLHKIGTYSKGAQRIMNEAEFGTTLNNALGYIGLSASPEQISRLFAEIDLGHEGWISYEVYFLFLKYYFGSLRGDNIKNDKQPYDPVDPHKEWLDSLANLSALDRFIRLLLDQLRNIFARYDFNKNMMFEENQIEAILHHVFGLNESETSYVLLKFFNFANRKEKSLKYEQLVKILLEIYFIEIVLKRKYKDLQSEQWKTRKISLSEFIDLVLFACSFLKSKPSRQDLTQIFKLLDTDQDGYITFSEYVDFIRKYLGVGLEEFEVKPLPPVPKEDDVKPNNISNEEWQFVNLIWSELKVYFDHYDSGSKGYLTEEDLKRFVVEVLNENTQRQLDYIFWNLFRIDPNKDRKTQFNEFAPFILNHAGEIALQRFHKNQVRGKTSLTEEELFIVFSNAFSFLKSMPKSQAAVKAIFNRIGKDGVVTYSHYCGWINKSLANKFRS